MKRLISGCLFLLFVVTGNAQVNKKPKLNELNQDQLNIALKGSKKTVRAGQILTVAGLSASAIGISILSKVNDDTPSNQIKTGAYTLLFGSLSWCIGVPIWIGGAIHKKKIKMELVKFNPPGSASINGIGLKIRF